MASGNKSKWGSFLSQAVAGVEARLDTILSEENEAPKDGSMPTQQTTTTPTPGASTSKPATATPRTSSSNRANDRLQERLARAMAAKAAARKQDEASTKPPISTQPSPRQSLDTTSRASVESAEQPSIAPSESASQRVSLDAPRISLGDPSVTASEQASRLDTTKEEDGKKDVDPEEEEKNGQRGSIEVAVSEERQKPETPPAQSTRTSVESEKSPVVDTDIPVAQVEEARGQVLDPVEAAKLQHQEEIHSYIERIDALEAKLQYLAREAGETARKEALAAPAGSAEKKLAEKDVQITQLMEEGKKLASTEQKHRTIIKKLRAKTTEDEKELKNLKATTEKATKEVDGLLVRARRADELEKANGELRRRLELSQKELNSLKPDVKTKDATIKDLKAKLEKATREAEAATAKVNDQAREQDRKRIAELEESVAALQVEKNLVADRAKIQINELKEKAERAAEQSRALELEMKAEVQVMESKLEAARFQAEEASSGAGGDSQAKLLRQVETLQTQYSIASENWQGIESTLQARLGNLERERDEAQQRESDMRKKAREASLRAKRAEEELEETKTKIPTFQEDVSRYQSQLDSLKTRAEQAEAALQQAKAGFERQKAALQSEREEKERQQRDNDNDRRGGWLEELSRTNSRPESPLLLTTPQRTFSSDGLLGLDMLTSKLRKASAPSSNGAGHQSADRLSRRPSFQPPPVRPSMTTHSSSNNHPAVFSPTTEVLPTPSSPAHPLDREDDRFDSVDPSSSPQQIVNDMVSVSTVAAGPSVQLVERMSAAIRRLESEKVAAREELARISNQRDEARAELVATMREAEAGRSALGRVEGLERRVAETEGRYEATLEELGEKIELVEELRADVQDVKAMYRELVERTVG